MEKIFSTPMSKAQQAINSVTKGKCAFCKFLSANDTGKTGGHQWGIYIPQSAWKLLFHTKGEKGFNKERFVKIKWQNDIETDSKFTYYGVGTRNEYRITRFGRGFDLFREENTGALVVIVQIDDDYYEGWVLEQEDDINRFLEFYGMLPSDTNSIIQENVNSDIVHNVKETQMFNEMDNFISGLKGGFPTGRIMSTTARNIYNSVYDHIEYVISKPDKELLAWNETEYTLFRRIEKMQFGDKIRNGFNSMEEFIDTANSVLNRRKSRAGKSLEYHLEEIFNGNKLKFETQVVTEERKKPDFVFPSGQAYHNLSYPSNKLIILGAKTTCKDRWRQVVTEADRVDVKYLCTLQQGVSLQQLHEMESEHVVLVVPKPYISMYPKEYRESIMDLKTFIAFVKETLA